MKAISKTCPQCGASLTNEALGSLCLKCLVELGAGESDLADGGLTLVSEPNEAGGTPDFISRSFGDYELLEELARGGMGVVYRARQCSLNRDVAIKMILYSQFAGQDYHKRFVAEAQAIARLRHPNIVAIHEVGLHDNQPFFSRSMSGDQAWLSS